MGLVCEKVAYRGWPTCYRLANQAVELIVTADVGPRILRFAPLGEPNVFFEVEDDWGKKGGETFRFYGGHRLWVAPETWERTYYPDNAAVAVSFENGVLRLLPPVETTTGIQKALQLRMAAETGRVTVEHELLNCSQEPMHLAPWSITMLAPDGMGILPLPKAGAHAENLLPVTALNLWAYTNLADPRWTLEQGFVFLRQAQDPTGPQKIGLGMGPGWMAYAHADWVFGKRFAIEPKGAYPDLGSAGEMFTNESMLELESLGPLVSLEPNESVTHVEHWALLFGLSNTLETEPLKRDLIPSLERLFAAS